MPIKHLSMDVVCVISDHPIHLTFMMVNLLRLGYPVLGANCDLAPALVPMVCPRQIHSLTAP